MSQVESLREKLFSLALQLGPGAKMPTARSIYEEFGTNWITLKAALDQLEEANAIDRRRGSGVYVSEKINRKTILILLDATLFRMPGASPFWGMLWSILADQAQARIAQTEQDCHFFLTDWADTSDLPLPQYVRETIARATIKDHLGHDTRIHGVIGIGINNRAVAWLQEKAIPLATYAGASNWEVEADSNEIYRLAVTYLQKQRCKRISCWEPVTNARDIDSVSISQYKLEKCLGLFRALGVNYDPGLMWPINKGDDELGRTYQHQGYNAAYHVFQQPKNKWPDGLFINDDMMTSGAIVALNELGVKIGRDVKVVSQSNRDSSILFGYDHLLAKVEIDPADISRELFSLLDSQLQPQTNTSSNGVHGSAPAQGGAPEPRTVLIQPRLIERSGGIGR